MGQGSGGADRARYQRGQPASAAWTDSGGEAVAATPSLPSSGLQASAQLPTLDLDAWTHLLPDDAAGSESTAGGTPNAPWSDWLPQQLMLKAGEVKLHERKLHDVSLQLSRSGKVWSNQIQARELAGRIDYHEASPQEPGGLVVAKLARLTVPEGSDNGLDSPAGPADSLRELPALQISVDDFQLGKRSLGSVDVQARNRWLTVGPGLREWELSRFNISTPEAVLTAKGFWSVSSADHKHPGQTQLQFQLNLRDVGKLLNRFEMPGVVANGQGSLQGDISWTGSPVTPDFKTLSGAVHLDVQKAASSRPNPVWPSCWAC